MEVIQKTKLCACGCGHEIEIKGISKKKFYSYECSVKYRKGNKKPIEVSKKEIYKIPHMTEGIFVKCPKCHHKFYKKL